MAGKWKSGYKKILAFILMFAMAATTFDLSLFSGALTVSAATATAIIRKDGHFWEWKDRMTETDFVQNVYAELSTGASADVGSTAAWTRLQNLITANSKLQDGGSFYGQRLYTYSTASPMDHTEIETVYRNLRIVYDAYRMDHPEAFWLTDAPQFRATYNQATSTQYFYLVLSDPFDASYDIRKAGYRDDATILTGIRAMNATISSITGSDTVNKITKFYEYLINNNDPGTAVLPVDSESISALTKIAGNNPDSAAYARAMKVLCDKAGIRCEIVTDNTGYMWNYIYISENDAWYAVDAYAGDKETAGGAVSDNYLLVGSDTEISGSTFGAAHEEKNIGPVSGFEFSNGEEVSATRYILNPQTINGITLMAPTKGKGTEASPYQIANQRQLFWFAAYVNGELKDHSSGGRPDLWAVLTNNITMTADWIPIGVDDAHAYSGTFDGQKHTIQGLKVGNNSTNHSADYAYGGLFGTVSGTIRNLHMTGAQFTGTSGSRGVISGKLTGTITYCYTDGSTLSSGTGGLAGDASGGTISYSYTTCGDLAASPGTVTRSFYQTALGGFDPEGSAQTAAEFKSGKVAFLMNQNTSTGELAVWHQNIENGTVDPYPVFDETHGRIYHDATANSYSNKLSPDITFENDSYVYNGESCFRVVLPDDIVGDYSLTYAYSQYPDNDDWIGDTGNWNSVSWTTLPGTFTSGALKPGRYYIRVRLQGAENYIDKTVYTRIWVQQRSMNNLNVELVQLSSGNITVNAVQIKDNGAKIEYTGSTVQYQLSVTDSGVTLTEGEDYQVTSSGSLVQAGTVTLTVTGLGNYVDDKTVTFDIVKKEASFEVSYQTNYTYGDEIKNPTLENIRHSNSDNNVTWGYQWSDSEGNILTGAPTEAGTYKLLITLNESTNYAKITKELVVTIEKKAPTRAEVTVADLADVIYDGEVHKAEVNPAAGIDPASLGNITVRYRLANSSGYISGEGPKNAGTYEVWASIAGGKNYSDVAFYTGKSFTIEPCPLTQDMLYLDSGTEDGASDGQGNYYYRGPDVAIRPAVKPGKGFLTEKDYTVHYTSVQEIGRASARVVGQGNFTGEIVINFDIIPKTITDPDDYYKIIGKPVQDNGILWYKGEVTIQPANPGDYTIWDDKGNHGSELVIKQEGVVVVNFFLKDLHGNYVYPSTYSMQTLTFLIDAKGPEMVNPDGGIIIKGIHYTTMRTTANFSTVDTDALWVDIQAKDQWSGLKGIYYYVQKVADDADNVQTLSKDDLDTKALNNEFQILAAPDSGNANSTQNKEYKAGFTLNLDGRYIIYAYAEDNFGNRSDYICSNGVAIDRTPPVINYVLAPTRAQGTLSDIDATVRFHASEPGTYYYTVLKAEDVANGTAEPTAEDLVINEESIGSGIMVAGLQNGEGVQNSFQLTGLEAMTEYIVYIAARDQAGNITAVNQAGNRTGDVAKQTFTTCKKIARFDEGQKPELTGIYGTPVRDMELTGPESNNDVAGAWIKVDEWANETTGDTRIWHVGQSVDVLYEVQFVPEDTETCEILTVQVTPEVSPRPIEVTLDDNTRKYLEDDPEFTISYDAGEIIGTDENTIGEWIVRRTDAAQDSDVGMYPIHGECINPDYLVTFTDGTLTVTKADARIEVGTTSYVKTFGDEAFTFEDITIVGQASLVYSIQSSKITRPVLEGASEQWGADGAVVSINGNGEVKIIGAGQAKIRLQLPESKNYHPSNAEIVTVTVKQHEKVDTTVEKKYVYAAGSKDTPVDLDLTEALPKDMGETLYGIAGITDIGEILELIDGGADIPDTEATENGGTDTEAAENGGSDTEAAENGGSDTEAAENGGSEAEIEALNDNAGISLQAASGKAAVSEKGHLTYQVKRVEESTIGTTAEIRLSVASANYKATTVTIRILIIDKIEVMNLTGENTAVQVLDASQLTYGLLLGDVALNTDTAVFVETGENGDKDVVVSGTLAWKEPDTVLEVRELTTGSWQFTPDDTETYQTVEGILSFTVEKAVPNVTLPTASPSQVTYNPAAALNEIMLNGTNGAWTVGGNAVTVPGTWSWQAADTTPTVDVTSYTAVFTPEDDSNYAPATVEVAVTVGRAVPHIAEYPVTTELTYGQTLGDAAFSGGSVQYSADANVNGYNTPVPGTFDWREKTLTPEVSDSAENNGTRYVAVFLPTDNVNYEERSFPLTVTVVPAEKPASTPTFSRLDISFDSTLEYIEEIASQLPEGWTWAETENWALQSGKEYYLTAIYVGADAGKGNYKQESVKITVKRGDCGHSRTEVRNKKEVGCLTNGYTGDTYCSACGNLLEKGTIIDAKGHTWNAGKIVVEPTCTEDGTVRYTCLVCGLEEDRHDRADVYATGHDWNSELTTIEATCTEAGSTAIRCKKCDAVQEGTYEEIPAPGHTGGAATCIAPAVCEICGEIYGEINPHNHPETEIRNVHEATCSEAGNTGDLYCLACGNLVQAGDTIEKPEHTWTNQMVTKMPTCVEPGIETAVCAACGEEKQEEIPATGVHQWDTKYTVDIAPTTKKEGSKSIHCTVCGVSKEGSAVKVPILPPTKNSKIKASNGDQYVVTKAATAKAQGTVEFKKAGNTGASKYVIQATVKINGYTYKITSVANNAFKGNTKLKNVTIGNNVTKIGNNAFANCTKLSTVTIGSKVTSIGTKAFAKCTALKKITIPAKVKTIGKQAFAGCKKLSDITIKTTKLKSSSVGSKAFNGISAGAVIKVPGKKLTSYRSILKAKGVGSRATIRS